MPQWNIAIDTSTLQQHHAGDEAVLLARGFGLGEGLEGGELRLCAGLRGALGRSRGRCRPGPDAYQRHLPGPQEDVQARPLRPGQGCTCRSCRCWEGKAPEATGTIIPI